MADEPEDVLELDPDTALEGDGDPQQTDGDADEGDGEEPLFGFEGDEAAPASESSVIREFRKREREKDRRIAELERANAPKPIEVGDEPAEADFDYDTDAWKVEWLAWNARKTKRAEEDAKNAERRQADAKAWGDIEQGYRGAVAELNVPNFDEAEREVADALPPELMAMLVRTRKPELILALRASPAKLAELSKLNLLDAALMVGELKGSVRNMGTRKPPAPDRAVRGGIAPASTDKALARHEKEAERTGNRTQLIAYRAKLKAKAN